jgi:hypothetical protein
VVNKLSEMINQRRMVRMPHATEMKNLGRRVRRVVGVDGSGCGGDNEGRGWLGLRRGGVANDGRK